MEKSVQSIARRRFLSAAPGAPLAALLATRLGSAQGPLHGCHFVHADLPGSGSPIPLRGFAEHSLEANAGEGLLLRWPAEVRGAAGFGFAIGTDYREFGNISVRLARSGKLLELVTVSLAPRFDPYFVPLTEADALAASREGILLRADAGKSRRSILSVEPSLRAQAPLLHPYLLVRGTLPPLGEYLRRMRSLDVIQEFDWRAGCVTEGLWALGEREALRRYLRWFLEESGVEAIADFRRGVEQTLPAAAIARIMPRNPVLEQAIAAWRQRRNAAGHIQDGTRIVAETNYTVAYPMLVLAGQRQDRGLRDEAITHLRATRERLQDRDGNLYLRHDERTGERTYLGWARGVAWYTLGLAASLDAMAPAERPQDLLDELRRSLRWALQYQRNDGLWPVFFHEPETAPDSSGSAGVAAALRIATRLGVGEATFPGAARRTLEGCIARLSVHGLLTGVAQSNRREGGPPFQRSSHRVSMQYAMGFLGVLLAETRKAGS